MPRAVLAMTAVFRSSAFASPVNRLCRACRKRCEPCCGRYVPRECDKTIRSPLVCNGYRCGSEYLVLSCAEEETLQTLYHPSVLRGGHVKEASSP